MKKEKKLNIAKIWDFIDKHHFLIYFIVITIFSIIVRYLLIKYHSGDYDMFLKPWFDELKINGGLMGLSKNIGNYTPIYMTILSILTYLPIDSLVSIKLVSITFDYIAAFFLFKIVMELLKNKKSNKKIALIVYTLYLFLPTVFLNSAYWAQSDIIYTCFILISIYYLLKQDFKKSIIFFSIALAFKFQAIFVFPLYVLVYIANHKEIKLRYFLIIPLVIFICSIPKICFSHNLLEGFEVYFNQSNTYSNYLTLNLPNFYSIYLKGLSSNPNLIETPFKEMGTIGIIVTLVIFAIIAFLVYQNKTKFSKQTIIEFALWSSLITTFFLPQMHERYLFVGDIISIIYLVINKKKYYIPILIQFISLNGYMYLLFSGFAINMTLLSIIYFITLILYTKDMYIKYFKKEFV